MFPRNTTRVLEPKIKICQTLVVAGCFFRLKKSIDARDDIFTFGVFLTSRTKFSNDPIIFSNDFYQTNLVLRFLTKFSKGKVKMLKMNMIL